MILDLDRDDVIRLEGALTTAARRYRLDIGLRRNKGPTGAPTRAMLRSEVEDLERLTKEVRRQLDREDGYGA